MMFKKKLLTPKQLFRAKFSAGLLGAFGALNLVAVSAEYFYNDNNYEKIDVWDWPTGQIVEFTNKDEFCHR